MPEKTPGEGKNDIGFNVYHRCRRAPVAGKDEIEPVPVRDGRFQLVHGGPLRGTTVTAAGS